MQIPSPQFAICNLHFSICNNTHSNTSDGTAPTHFPTGTKMSVQTLYTAATGMDALETKLDVIANNMANINTTGFKKDRANFEDLFYRQIRLPGAEDADGTITSTGIEDRTWHARFQHANQPRTRCAANDQQSARLCHRRSRILLGHQPRRRIALHPSRELRHQCTDNNWCSVRRTPAGFSIRPSTFRLKRSTWPSPPTARCNTARATTSRCKTAGQIQVTTFIDPDGLLKIGDNLYQETPASGSPTPRHSRSERRRRDSTRCSGSFQRRTGAGIDRPDHDPTSLRA